MIHDVHLPDETKEYLWQLVLAQMDLILAAAKLEEAFTEDNMRIRLSKMTSAHRAEQLSKWLFSHPSPRQALEQFFNHNSLEEKVSIVRRMRRDVVRLYRGVGSESLEHYFPKLGLLHYQEGLKKFLIYFYENLDVGLSTSLLRSNPSHYKKYGREQFFAAFEVENLEQYVCAICDEHRHMTILRGEYFSDIEHYFPKSIYPHLACHPYNLIPICKQCNAVHLDRDPLLATDGSRRTLGNIFLPYKVESIFKEGLLKLDWQHVAPKEIPPHLEIRSRHDTDDGFYRKLQAFSEIYDIPGRWQGRIHQIGEQLWRYIRQYVRVEIKKDASIDLMQLKVELEQLLAYLYDDLGKSPWTFVLIWYLGNMVIEEVETEIQNPNHSNIIPLLDTVRAVMEERKNPITPRRLHTEEVLNTARKLYKHGKVET